MALTTLSPEQIAALTPAEAQRYAILLERDVALQSPLHLAELMFPETRRWPHLELLNEYLLALSEYRLTQEGPVPPEQVSWWYEEENGTRKQAASPHDIPEVVGAFGADTPKGPVVFRLAISMRPRAGKSRLVTEVLPFWLQLQAQGRIQIGVGTYSDTFAADWGGQARDFAMHFHEKHPWFPAPTGGFRGAREVFDLPQGGKIRYVGVGGGITGKTLHWLIGDDFIKNDADAQSEATRKGSHKFYDRTWKTRKTRDLAPGARFPFPLEIIMATRWHEDDVLGHAVFDGETREQRDDWAYLNIPALSKGEGDPLGRPEGEAHPNAAGETRADMERLRDDDPRGFSALYQGDPSPEEGGLIPGDFGMYWVKDQDLFWYSKEEDSNIPQIFTLPSEDLVRFIAIDVAATEKTSSDWTVAFACGYSREYDKLFILGRYRKRITTDKYLDELLPFMSEHDCWLVLCENVTYGQKLRQDFEAMRRKGHTKIRVHDDMPRMTDKVHRALASGLPSLMRRKRVLVLKNEPWQEEASNELKLFPFGTFDDQVDALAFAAHFVTSLPAYREHRRPPVKSLAETLDEHVEKKARKKRSRGRKRDLWSQI